MAPSRSFSRSFSSLRVANEKMFTLQMCSARMDATNEGDGMNPRTRDSLLTEEMALAPGALPLESGPRVHWAPDLSVQKDIFVTFVW